MFIKSKRWESRFYKIWLKKSIKNFLFYIGVQLINNGMLASGTEQNDSAMHRCVSILSQILSWFRLLQSIEYTSLCYKAGPYCLSILNIEECTSISNSQSIPLIKFPSWVNFFLKFKNTLFSNYWVKILHLIVWNATKYLLSWEIIVFFFFFFKPETLY